MTHGESRRWRGNVGGFVAAAVAVALATVAAVAPVGQSAVDQTRDAQGSGFVRDRLERGERFVERHVERGTLPGAVLLLARRGKPGSLSAFGFSDLESKRRMRPDDICRLASATKIVTSVALLSLYEEGHFALRDPVGDYLPEFKNLTVHTADGGIMAASKPLTVRDLLGHTTGYGS